MTAGWHHGPMTPFDLESTGVDVETARVVSATVARIHPADGQRQTEVWSWLVAVDVDIPAEATAVHGITTEHAREHGKPAAEVVDLVTAELALSLVDGVPVVGMNLVYDFTVLDRECRRLDLPTLTDRLAGLPIAPVIDVMVIDKAMDRYRPGKRKLTDLCEHYDARIDGAHDATHDAIAAARVAWRMGWRANLPADQLAGLYADRRHPELLVRRWQQLAGKSLDDLHAMQVRCYAEQSTSFAAYLREEREELRIRADDTDDSAERDLLHSDIAALDARIDAIDGSWPIRPVPAEVTR